MRPRQVGLFRCETGQEFRSLSDYPKNKRTQWTAPEFSVVDGAGRLAAIHCSRGIMLVDLQHEGQELAVLSLPTRNYPLRFDADGALWTYGISGVLRWPIREGPRELRVGPPEILDNFTTNAVGSASSRDGKVLAFANYPHGPLLWQSDRQRFFRLGPQDDVRFCSVSPDGRWVATGSHGHHRNSAPVQVWDGSDGSHVVNLNIAEERGCAVGFSPDGKWLLATGEVFHLYEVGTWREICTLGHNAGFAFTDNGSMLALGDDATGVVRLVIPQTGREIGRLTGPQATRLQPICFTPDGALLLSRGTETMEVHVFDIRPIRRQLKKMNLDWEAPPLPDAPEERFEPLQVKLDLGSSLTKVEADRLVAKASKLAGEKKHAEALIALRQAIKIDPSHAQAHNDLAWLLLAGPKELRDPKAALPLARKAVESTPKPTVELNTLGLVLYRNAAYKEAVPILDKSLAANQGNIDAHDLFVLAMCHARLGEADQARDCFDRAVKWIEKQKNLPPQYVEELKVFRAEAEEVMRTL